MLKRFPLTLALAIVLIGGFIAVIYQLFSLRFESGDIYPPYSTFRTDPLGSRAFYESVDSLPEMAVDRWLEAGAKMPPQSTDGSTAIFLLGLPHQALRTVDKVEVAAMEEFMRKGGQVIITFKPISGTGWFDRMQAENEAEEAKKAEKLGKRRRAEQSKEKQEKAPDDELDDKPLPKNRRLREKEKERERELYFVDLQKQWGMKFKESSLPLDGEGNPATIHIERSTNSFANLPEKLPWHSSLQLDGLSAEWQAVYYWNGLPMVAERKWGKGRLVMCTDSYLFSNEALKFHREPTFLAWTLTTADRVFFNETHLGVMQDPGVATLIRKYRLHGVAIVLVLLAGLFIWRNSLSLVPPDGTLESATAQVAGRDAGSGFLNLLYRSIPPKELLKVALHEWRRSARGLCGTRADKVAQMEALVTADQADGKQTNPVQTYRDLVKVWKRR